MNEPSGFCMRNLRESDLPALLEIERSCFWDPWPAMWFRRPIRARDFCWGVCDGNRLVGYLIACREDETLHIANLAIDPDYRNQGAATSLIKRIVQAATDERFKDIYLEVRRSNEEAIRLYERFGFKVTGVEENYYEGQEDALIMRITINGMV